MLFNTFTRVAGAMALLLPIAIAAPIQCEALAISARGDPDHPDTSHGHDPNWHGIRLVGRGHPDYDPPSPGHRGTPEDPNILRIPPRSTAGGPGKNDPNSINIQPAHGHGSNSIDIQPADGHGSNSIDIQPADGHGSNSTNIQPVSSST